MWRLKNKGGIYCLTNKVNGKKYIGQSKNLYIRISTHRNNLLTNKHENRYLQASYNKHGEGSFEVTILEICTEAELSEREMYWIAYYDTFRNGYNLTIGGEGSNGLYGEESNRYDDTKYTFYHDELGVEEDKTMYYMKQKYHLFSSGLSDVVNGKAYSVKGWRLTENKPDRRCKLYNFYNNNGTEELGVSKKYMVEKYGIEMKKISSLTTGNIKIYNGWTLEKGLEVLTGKNLQYTLVNVNGERLENMNTSELAEAIGVDRSMINLVVGGKQLGVKEWTTEEKLPAFMEYHQLGIYSFISKKGKVVRNVTTKYMRETYMLSKEQIKQIISDSTKSVKGWSLHQE